MACHSSLTKAQYQAPDRVQQVDIADITGTTQQEDLGLEKLEPRQEHVCLNFGKRTADGYISAITGKD